MSNPLLRLYERFVMACRTFRLKVTFCDQRFSPPLSKKQKEQLHRFRGICVHYVPQAVVSAERTYVTEYIEKNKDCINSMCSIGFPCIVIPTRHVLCAKVETIHFPAERQRYICLHLRVDCKKVPLGDEREFVECVFRDFRQQHNTLLTYISQELDCDISYEASDRTVLELLTY